MLSRKVILPMALLALPCFAGCPAPSDRPSPAPSGTATASDRASEEVAVVAASRSSAGPYLDGMRLAVEELNQASAPNAPSLSLTRSASVPEALASRPSAVVVIEDAAAVSSARVAIEEADLPILLLGGDLYSTRGMFRQVFQVGPPLLWQARVLARYLAVDRGYREIRAVAGGPSIEAQRAALREAFREEGIRGRSALPLQRVLGDPQVVSGVEALLFLGGRGETAELARAVATLEDPPQLALSSEGLAREVPAPAGTVSAYHYAWAGWAEPIERVRSFRRSFAARHEREPSVAEQEGYEAIRALAEASGRSDARGLVRALETVKEETYSALPVVLGPDDHVLVDESQLGLFAADAPAAGEPWVLDPPYWRPLMRTFTYDGEKTNVLDLDKVVFFPSWKPPRPSPKFHRSRFGIVTGYGKDPLH